MTITLRTYIIFPVCVHVVDILFTLLLIKIQSNKKSLDLQWQGVVWSFIVGGLKLGLGASRVAKSASINFIESHGYQSKKYNFIVKWQGIVGIILLVQSLIFLICVAPTVIITYRKQTNVRLNEWYNQERLQLQGGRHNLEEGARREMRQQSSSSFRQHQS